MWCPASIYSFQSLYYPSQFSHQFFSTLYHTYCMPMTQLLYRSFLNTFRWLNLFYNQLFLLFHPGCHQIVNPSTTEFLLIGLPQQTCEIIDTILSLPIALPILPMLSAKNLGLLFDSTLSFPKQICSLSSSSHCHICNICLFVNP